MAPTLKILSVTVALLLSFSSNGSAQYGQLPHANQFSMGQASQVVGYGSYDQYAQSGTYGAYPYPSSAEAVHQLYHQNARKPLRGLFADGFTRTLTVLGGANFLNSIQSDENLLSSIPGSDALASPAIDPQTGYAISFAFGRRHNHRLRSEIELALRRNDTSFEFELPAIDDVMDLLPRQNGADDKIMAYSIMKNFTVDIPNRSRLTPYVGAGLGFSYLDLDAPSIVISEGVGAFSYQAIGGVSTTINNAAEFIVEYRFFGTSKVEMDSVSDSFAYNAHDLFLGIKFEY